MFKTAVWSLLLLLTLLNFNTSFAQISESEYIASMTNAAMRTWRQRVKPEFMAVADKEARIVIESTKLSIPRIGNFNAFSGFDGKTPKILIPFGLLAGNDYLIKNGLFSIHHPDCRKHLDKVILKYKNAYFKFAESGVIQKLKGVWDYCGFSQQETESFFRQKEIYDASVAYQVDALAGVIGHELGHIILKHRHYSEITKAESVNQEFSADDYGFDLAMRAGFNPASALGTTYVFFMAMEGRNAPTGTHPRASCRIVRISEAILLDKYVKKEYWKKEFKEPPGKAEMERLTSALAPLREDCSSL